MQYTFDIYFGAQPLPSGLANWNTSNVTSMQEIFGITNSGLSSSVFTNILAITNWNVSQNTNLEYAFIKQKLLTSISLPHWNTSKVKNLRSLINTCSQLQTLDISYWNTSQVTQADYFLQTCSKLKINSRIYLVNFLPKQASETYSGDI